MPDAVVLADGDLPALVAARLAAEEGAGLRVWDVSGEAAAAAVAAQTELLEAQTLGRSQPGDDLALMLLRAARAAAAGGAERLVWPVAVGADLDRMSSHADRALLISRLIALEPELGPTAGAGRFSVQTPLLDLSDAQVAEVAIDLDVPVWRCWWWPAVPLTCSEVSASGRPTRSEVSASGPGSPFEPPALEAAKALAQRWTTALRAAGWSEDIELASITSG